MSYSVFLHPQVVKFLKKIPKTDVERIKTKLAELSDPTP
ncbi:plasmid stabilization system addiction module toxin, RelE/StbE family [Ferroglobus placidus DSM 10642]|uniref:Plasmid stabilization system addiction module toxin, RelE/StbE family n=1 Tax=Ferroglobus placidus (strain DSM 10642 / AEDII12DO) TaxID=589924 RepID=D3S229_FERPA|nr:plasmid stabilization system addiction module toxin, RelE/StbE family [Ferroglobus placidus DSM 10642]